MRMRERLIELLREMKLVPVANMCAECPRPSDGVRDCGRCKLERDADFLIANGVIVSEKTTAGSAIAAVQEAAEECKACNAPFELMFGETMGL